MGTGCHRDRADVDFVVKEYTRKMQSPGGSDMQRLKWLGRYLKGAPRAVMWVGGQDDVQIIDIFIDADEAGC